jgi:nucleoside-diphosphate-sugar epimerase
MHDKIVITGGLGYIGTEIVKILKNNKNIIVIDKKYDKKKIYELKKKKIKFIQGNILDAKFVKKVIHDAKVIYHLAAITKVATTKSQARSYYENIISNNAINGMKNIIKYSNIESKIIFPSSHLIFEGSKNQGAIYNENSRPCPLLSYGRSKLESEKMLKNSKRNYIILRLSSVYGFNGDEKRMFNMPNLFAKRSKKNLPLKLFAGGLQIKSIVSIKDVARTFLFFTKRNIKNQIFNVSSENLKVIEIANMCADIRPEVLLIKTKDEIPNNGYSMNNNKLKKIKFKFKYNYIKFLNCYLN